MAIQDSVRVAATQFKYMKGGWWLSWGLGHGLDVLIDALINQVLGQVLDQNLNYTLVWGNGRGPGCM